MLVFAMSERSGTTAGSFRSSGGGISFSMTTGQLKNRSPAAEAEVGKTSCEFLH